MTDKKKVLSEADEEIAAFEKWFRGQGAEPLARFETAILKTFLVAKATGKFRSPSGPQDGQTSEVSALNYNHYLIGK